MLKEKGNNEGLPGVARGEGRGCPYSLVPNKIVLVFLCSCVRFWCSLFPKICFCSGVPSFIFFLFPYSPKVNGHVPMFPKTPGRPSIIEMLTQPPSHRGYPNFTDGLPHPQEVDLPATKQALQGNYKIVITLYLVLT